jgi:hypothetical protein
VVVVVGVVVVLTYDTTLQVISRSSQRDFLGSLIFLGSHFFALLFCSVSATEKSRDSSLSCEEVGGGKGRTSCEW